MRAWNEKSKTIEAGGSGRLVTRCFTTPSPLLLLLLFALPRTSPTFSLLALLMELFGRVSASFWGIECPRQRPD